MDNRFSDMEIHNLLEHAYEMDKKPLEMYIRMIGSPNRINDLTEIFYQSIVTNGHQFTTCMKIIEKSRRKEFFHVLMEGVQKANKPIQVQSIFKSCNAIPEDIECIKASMKSIVDAMQNNMDTEVFYHGICLLYRMINKFPELEEDLKTLQMHMDYEEIQKIVRKFDILEKWETANHRGKDKPGYFMNENEFLEFALKFTKIK